MNKFFLSVFLASGAAIGSGVLALPILAAKLGILNTYLFISITFFIAYQISKQTFEVYQERYPNKEVNAATLVKDHLGFVALVFVIIINILNMGLDCASYVNVGGDLTTNILFPILGIHTNQIVGMIAFIAVTLPVFALGIKYVSSANGIIFCVKMTMLYSAIFLGSSYFDASIFHFSFERFKFIAAGASTFFCIWGMHMTLPIILRMNDYDVKKASRAVLLGLLIPGVAYFGWLLLIYSLVPESAFINIHQVSDILVYLGNNHPEVPSLIKSLVSGFASITALTAFFSIGYSMMVFFMDWFGWENNVKHRIISAIMSFTLPVIVSALFAKQFVLIYQQSNMFFTLCAIVPIIVALKSKKNRLMNSFLFVCAIAFVVCQLVDNFA